MFIGRNLSTNKMQRTNISVLLNIVYGEIFPSAVLYPSFALLRFYVWFWKAISKANKANFTIFPESENHFCSNHNNNVSLSQILSFKVRERVESPNCFKRSRCLHSALCYTRFVHRMFVRELRGHAMPIIAFL